jgi:hypothetical protein
MMSGIDIGGGGGATPTPTTEVEIVASPTGEQKVLVAGTGKRRMILVALAVLAFVGTVGVTATVTAVAVGGSNKLVGGGSPISDSCRMSTRDPWPMETMYPTTR